jgi:hypothetical protein
MKNLKNWVYRFGTRLVWSISVLFVILVLLGITMNACNNEEELINTTLKDEKLETRNNEDCFDIWEIWNTCNESGLKFGKSGTIEIDDDCEIEVTWDEYYCSKYDPIAQVYTYTIIIENFEYNIPDEECLDQIQAWKVLEAQGKTDELAEALDEFEYEASLALEQMIVLEHDAKVTDLIPDCDDIDPNFVVFTEYYTNICYQYIPGPSGGQLPDFTNIIKSPCGQICCQRNAQYCYDGNILIRSDLGYNLSSGTCDEEPINPPVGMTQAWGDCDHDCIPE